jgi:coenzyme F420 hydrogenase subunit beta
MENQQKSMGQQKLRETVVTTELCTGCGACNSGCPYFATYKDNTVIVQSCNLDEGKCYAHCPRTPINLDLLKQELYDQDNLTPELGPFLGLYMTRSTDEKVLAGAQHGGTISTLISLALQEGFIDTAILAGEDKSYAAEGLAAENSDQVTRGGKSKFTVSPTVAAFHAAAKGDTEKIGAVTTPCQAQAFAKMRHDPQDERQIDKLKLVIGVFCGWALSWRELKALFNEKIGDEEILGYDIPPSKYQCMEVYTPSGTKIIPLDQVLPTVRDNCYSCSDLTCEFSDIAVGSARSPEGWEVDKGWNQLIVRTPLGQQLLELARDKGLLEFKEVPEGNLQRLKNASMNKKRTALKNLVAKSGSADNLLYLDPEDSVFKGLLAELADQGQNS